MKLTITNIRNLERRLKVFRTSNPTISIVIPAFNEEHYILDCLDALSRINIPHGERIELIVVNNASTDRTQRWLDILGIRTVFESKKGLVFARAAGIKAARGTYVFQTDADSYVPRDWIAHTLPALKKEGIAGITGPILYQITTTHWLMVLYWQLSLWRRGAPTSQRSGAFIAYRKDSVRKVIERCCLYGDAGEDQRLCLFLEKHGRVDYLRTLPSVATHGRRFGSLTAATRYIAKRLVDKFRYKTHLWFKGGTELSWYLQQTAMMDIR